MGFTCLRSVPLCGLCASAFKSDSVFPRHGPGLWLVALPWFIFADPTETNYERACAALTTAKPSDAERLHQLFKLDWERAMIESPEFATEVGYPGLNHR